MLKRIAVLGKKDSLAKSIQKKVTNGDIEVVHIAAGEPLPPGTSAVVSDEGVDGLIKAASILGTRTEEILELLSDAIDCREQFNPGTSRRIVQHAARFADALGLSSDEKLTLERGALVRDIGKLKIHNDILLKKTLLSHGDWSTIRQHTKIGSVLVAKVAGLDDTEEIVLSHHECYDGTGYPDALEGDAIPPLAHMMKILDVYCAITSPRHYREGHCSHEEAIENLKAESGKHFKPALVEAFIEHNVGKTE